MSDQFEPRWELLPHDPATFFRLFENFDLRDLKRAYSQLVRTFKPERYPNEFQRIRAAYESLLRMVGDDQLGGSTPVKNWPASVDPAHSAPASPPPFPPLPRPFRAESALPEPNPPVEDPSLIQQYEQLKSRPAKSPGDFMTLALLSDLVPAESATTVAGESFVDWILAGLAKHPNDWGLTLLLREFMSEQRELAQIAPLLLRIVEIVPSTRFQYVTQQAWRRLLREGTIEEFRECLRRCGTQLGKSVDHSQLMFYVFVLRLMVWRDEADLWREIRGTVEDHFHHLNLHLQREYETVLSLRGYRSLRKEFIQLGSACRRIDQTMHDWSQLPETEGDLSVLECQAYLNERGANLLDEFPYFPVDYSSALVPWSWVVSDVMLRLNTPKAPDAEALILQTKLFMIRIERQRKRTKQYNRALGVFYGGLAGMPVSFVLLCVYFYVEEQTRLGGYALFGVLAPILATSALILFVGALVTARWGQEMMRSQYKLLRPELLRLMRVAPIRVDQLAPWIVQREYVYNGPTMIFQGTKMITETMEQDPAMAFFSLAQACLHAATPPQLDEPENA